MSDNSSNLFLSGINQMGKSVRDELDELTFTGLSGTPISYDDGKFLVSLPDGIGYTGLSGQISSEEIDWNVYATPSDLPDASIHHGMFAHVHSEDAAYMAHAGQWEKIYPQSFTGLSDTPSSLTADKYLKVNSAGDGFVFADAGGGGGGDSSGCCNTIKIRKNDADTPTSAMAASAIDYIAVKYANHWGTWGSWQYANLDDITDGDPNTYWRPTTSSSSVMYQFILKFKDDIHINAIQWSGDPWWGRLDEIESSSSKKYDMTSSTMYAITPFTSQNLGEITTKATTGVAVSAPWGTTNPSAVPVLDFTNLGGDGKVNRMYWQADDGDYPTPAGGINPKITDIKLAYSLTDPSTLNYIVERPFASGISASTNATIYLQRGQFYTFDIESDGNPFYIKTANSAGTSDLFSAGVTNNGVTEGNLTFQVPYDAPETLYYVSSNVPTLSGMIKILAADGGSHGGGGSTTGVTGVESLGAGSELASGVSGSDLYLKSLVGGTNVTLSSDDNTITINAAGGGGGGGTSSGSCVGGNAKLKELTSFSGDDRGLPDAILLTGASDSNLGSNWTALMKLGYSNLAGTITYNTMGTSSHSPPNFYIRFHDNASASFDSSNLNSVPTAIGAGTLPNSISGFVKSGYGIYYCGGAGGDNSSGECSHSIIHLQSDITNDGVSGIWDKSPLNNNTIVNGVVNSTTQVHRGNSSFYYDGASPLTSHIEIGTCEFIYADRTDATIESWIYWDPDTSSPNDDCLVACVSTTNPRDGDYVINFEKDTGTLLIIFGGKGAYRFNLTDIGVPEQTWFHLAFCNHQGVQKIYIDGVGHNLDSITPVSPGSWGSREGVYIGHWNANGRYEFKGYLQDFRITRGKCVYTENFTPPSDLLPISCGGGNCNAGGSTTGITGVESLGAGSELASGVSGSDLYLKSLVGGTNVTLSSDDNTITINAAGGGGSSTASGTGIGNSLFFEDRSNYYSRIPDEIIFNGDTTVSDFSFSARLASVRDGATNPEIRYDFLTTNGSNDYIRFNNNAQGTYNSTLSAGGFSVSHISGMSATDSLSGLIESGIFEPVYYNLGGSSSAGGGAGGSGGIGSNPYVTGASNFYTTLPDVILAPQVIDVTYPQGKWNWPLYLSFVTDDPAQTQGIRYVGQGHSSTAYTFFKNDLSGTTQGPSAVIDNSISSLSGYIASGRAVYFGGGGSSSSSSSAGDLPVSGLQNNKFLTGSSNASNFERDLPDALFVSGGGGAAGSLIKVAFAGKAGNYYMYANQINPSTTCRMDFSTLDVSGSEIPGNRINTSTPYASLAEMIDSGAAIYY